MYSIFSTFLLYLILIMCLNVTPLLNLIYMPHLSSTRLAM